MALSCDCHWEGAKCCTPSTKLTKGSDRIQIQFKFEGEVRIETSNSTNTCDSEFMLTEFISNAVCFSQKMVYFGLVEQFSQDLNKESSLLNCLEIHEKKITIDHLCGVGVISGCVSKRPKKNTPASKWPFKLTQKIQVTKKPQTFKGHLFFSTQKGHWEEELGKNTLDIKFLPGCCSLISLISSDQTSRNLRRLVGKPSDWVWFPCTVGPHGLRLPIKTSGCQIGWCFSGCQNGFF